MENMSIRLRLLLSYLLMLAVPLLLSGFALLIMLGSFAEHFGSVYRLDRYEGNPVQAILRQEGAVVSDIRQHAETDPSRMLAPATQQELDDRLGQINMGLVVVRGGEPAFVSPSLEYEPEPARLPKLLEKLAADTVESRMLILDGWLLFDQITIPFADGREGSAFVVMDLYVFGDFLADFLGESVPWLFLAMLVIFVLTNGFLTYFVSRSIIRPLRELMRATKEMKEGNLAVSIDTSGRDEFGDLSRSFDDMRRRLKQSVDLQMQYENNRKELIANISHDLKTPISSIKGYVEGIFDGVADTPEKLDRYLRTIHAKTQQMDRLIDELFLFSKLDLNRLSFQFEPVEIAALLRECADAMAIDLEKRGIECRLAVPDELETLRVPADRSHLKRAVTNILENAAKYMDKNPGLIRIKVGDAGNWLVVQVEDNGRGIEPEALPHIFDRFYRADPARNSDQGGSGLGLAIVKQIIEGHGGRVEARSAPGQGTSIYFSLPKPGAGSANGTEGRMNDAAHSDR